MSIAARDFDPVTNKLVPVGPDKTPLLANPLGLAPSGSVPGSLSAVDWFRTMATGWGVYGLASGATQLWTFLSGHPEFLGPHSAQIITAVNATVAATVAISHLVHSYSGNSRA